MPEFDLDAALETPAPGDNIQCCCGSRYMELNESWISPDGYKGWMAAKCSECGETQNFDLVWKHGEDGSNRVVSMDAPATAAYCHRCHAQGEFRHEAPELRFMPRENDDPQYLALTRYVTCPDSRWCNRGHTGHRPRYFCAAARAIM